MKQTRQLSKSLTKKSNIHVQLYNVHQSKLDLSNQELPGLKDQKLSQENFSSLVPSIGEKENAVKMPTCISIIRTFSDNLINWTRI